VTRTTTLFSGSSIGFGFSFRAIGGGERRQ
jgi:hypothetical protein